jgi:hypothetical protein
VAKGSRPSVLAVARHLLTCRSERPKAESGGRVALEIKSVDSLVGTPISYAYAIKAGPWVFLTGHEAFDWRTGTIDASVSGPAGFPAYGTRHPSRREADFVLRRMTDVLSEYGTDLSHAIRLDQYYPNPRAVAA